MSCTRGDVIRVRRIIEKINSAEGRELKLIKMHGKDRCVLRDEVIYNDEELMDNDFDNWEPFVGPYYKPLPRVEAYLKGVWPQHFPKQQRDWSAILVQAKAIVEGYDTGVTLRQLFYQLVSRQIIDNTLYCYTYLSWKSAEGRREGTFPDLIDKTSNVLLPEWFYSPEDAIEELRGDYRRDRTEGQEVSIYLAVEKAAIETQLWTWFGAPLGIPILALGGYGSQSYMDQIKRHVGRHLYLDGRRVTKRELKVEQERISREVREATDKKVCERKLTGLEKLKVQREGMKGLTARMPKIRPAVLIYAGDHDASGDDIYRDLVERTDCWKAVHRVALSREQVEQYNLPQNTGKEDNEGEATDPRAQAFMERHGYDENIQVEMDAIDPVTLRQLYQEVIDQYWDSDAYDEVVAREDDERERFQAPVDADE